MMGRTHALCGAATMLTGLTLIDTPHSPATVVVAAATAAGAALLPDLDHHTSTITHSLGPISRLLSSLVSAISGGHRHATHSLAGLLLAGIAAHALLGLDPRILTAATGFLIALSAGALGLTASRTTRILIITAAVVATLGLTLELPGGGLDHSLLPWAITLGIATHIATDMLTGTVALLHPLPTQLGYPLLKTGGTIENLLIGPALAIMIVVQLAALTTGGGPR